MQKATCRWPGWPVVVGFGRGGAAKRRRLARPSGRFAEGEPWFDAPIAWMQTLRNNSETAMTNAQSSNES
jgi:hypothetical protein